MKNQKHTQGEWGIFNKGNELSIRLKDSLEETCTVKMKASIQETEANAQLIATAPELLFKIQSSNSDLELISIIIGKDHPVYELIQGVICQNEKTIKKTII